MAAIVMFVLYSSVGLFEAVSSECQRDPSINSGFLPQRGSARGSKASIDSLTFGPTQFFSGFDGPTGTLLGLTSCGGGLSIKSSSPIFPTGLTVDSQNDIEGRVTVTGQLPFLGAVVTDGVFSTVGSGAVAYECGDGNVGITSERPITAAGPASPWSGLNRPGFNRCNNI